MFVEWREYFQRRFPQRNPEEESLLFWICPWICFAWPRCISNIKKLHTKAAHSEVLEDPGVISLHAGAYSSPSFDSGNFIMTIVKAPRGPFKLPSFHFHLYCSPSSVTFGCASPWQRTLALVSDSDIIQSISASEWVIMSPTLRCYGAGNRLTFLLKISLGTTSVIISQNAPFIPQQTWTKNKKERGMLGASQVDKDCFFFSLREKGCAHRERNTT